MRRGEMKDSSNVTLVPESDILTMRQSLGMTQVELATALGVSVRTVCRWEAGTSTVHPIYRERVEALVWLKQGDTMGEADASAVVD